MPDDVPDGYALIRVEACGICGTDLSNAESQLEDWQPFGHEIAGVIDKLGTHAGGLKIGDKVVLESASYCGKCELCRSGRVDLCNKAPHFWNAGPSLGFSDYLLAPVCGIVPYEGMTPEAACLAEPAGVAYDMVKTAEIEHGNRARLEAAAKLGAETLAADRPWTEYEELRGRFDRVLLTAPVQTIPEAIPLLAYGGILSYIGIGTGSGMIRFDANDFHYRKLQLRASFASPALYYPIVLKMLKSGAIPADTIISHRLPLNEIGRAMKLCREDKGETVKVVVTP